MTLTVVGGSAVESVDYEPLLVPVVIRAGVLELTVSIRTIEDDVTEATETLVLELSVLSGPAVTGAVDRVTVSIVDDDEAPELPEVVVVTATLRVSELSVSEGDTATLNIELSEAASEDVTLTLTVVAGGSADESVDYEPLLVPVVIRAGVLELTVSIRTIEDDLTEATETLVLELSVVDGPAVTGAVDRVTVSIMDDDEAPVVPELPEVVVVTATLRVSELSVSEGDTATLNIELSEAASEDVTLTLTVVAGGSAVESVDYEPLLVPVVIRAGLSELTVSIRTIEDDVTEATETLVLELSVLDGPAVTGAVDRVTVSIVDDDEAPVVPELPEVVVLTATLRVSELSVSEGDTATLNIELSEAASEDVTLTLTVVAGGSAVESVDYEPLLVPVVIRAGVLELTVSIRTIDDDLTEATETLVLELSVLDGPAVTGAVDRVTVSIVDDDEAPVVPELPEVVVVTATLRVSELSVSEGDTATLNIELSEAASEDVTLTLTVVAGGSAVESVDYESLLVPVVIRADVLELTVSIRTIDDDVTEETETFELVLSVLSGPAVTGTVDSVTVTIIDDDEAPVAPELPEVVVVTATLRVSELSVSEGDTATLNIELSEAASEDVTLTLTVVAGGSAVESVDYESLLVPVVIRAGVLELTVSIRTIEDDLTEATETLVLELSVLSGPAVTGAVDRVTVSIVDDDEAPVVPELPEVVVVTATLRVSELSVSEGDTATLNIELSEAASEDVTLTLTVVAGGSAVESVDYEPLLVPVVIRAGLLELTVSIRTIEDDLTEATETLVLELSVVDGPAVTGAVDRVTVSIVDDDEAPELPEVVVVTATLRVSELSVSEGDTATLNIELSEPTSEDVTLTLTVVAGGSADESVDYEPLLVPVVIRAGLSELTVSIRTIEDDLTEATETLVLELSVLDGPAVTGAVDRVTVSIVDDDEAPVVPELPEMVVVTATLRVSELSVSEGDTATLNIELSEAASEDVTLTLTVVAGGSAVESVDYESLLVPVVIRAGVLELTVSIRTIDDDVTEETETFELVLSVLSGPAVTGTVDSVTVTIIDDDEAPVAPELPEVVVVTATLRVSELSVSEGDTATLNIELSEAASEDVTLTLTVVGGSADESVDYEPLLVPVVIRAGLLELTVSIRTIEDDVTEATETLVLELSVVDGPAVTGAVDRVTVTITDDDEAPVVPELPEVVVVTATLRVSELSVSEGDTATLNIELSEAASEDVTLTLTVVAGGSAVESVDYDPLLVPVVIRAGVLELTVSIRTIEDDLTEATETLVLELSVVDGPAVTGAVDRVTVSIVDDDEAPVVPELPEAVVVTATLRVSELSVSEGDTATLNIELSEAASEDVTLTLTVVAGGSAVESVDYEPLLVPVVIRAGVSELTVSIRTIDDDVTEETETLVLELSVVDGPAVTGTVDSVTVTILDDDEAPVAPELPEVVVVTATLRVSELSVSEGDTATLNIELSEAVSEDVTLTLTVVAGGSAVESVDYEPLLVPVVIRAGLSELTVSIRTIDDDVTEETETFELVLSVLSGPAVTGTVDSVTVTIIDDDEAPVAPELPEVVVVTATLSTANLAVEEGQDATFVVRLSEVSADNLTFALSLLDGTALEVEDYSLPVMPIVVPAGDLGVTVTIAVLSDTLYEPTETVRFELTPTAGANVVLDTPSELSLEIIEQFSERGNVYASIVAFENQVETCNSELDTCVVTDIGTYPEPLGLVLQDASATRDTLQELPAGYQYVAGSALADIYFVNDAGDIVSNLNRAVTITTSVSRVQVDSLGGPERVSFAVLHDGETVWELPVTTYDAGAEKYTFATTSSRFSIFALVSMDELIPTLSFEGLDAVIREGRGDEFTVNLSTPLGVPLTILFSSVTSSTARVGDDYTLPDPVTIPASQTSVQLRLNTIQNTTYGGDKQLVLIATGTGEGVEPLVTEVVVTIEEDDPLPTVSLDPISSVMEGRSRLITARLNTVAAVTVLVSLARDDASTAAEDDYALSPLSIPLVADELTVQFELTANQDALYELTEKLVLQPRVSYGEDTLVGMTQAVMIIEDDPPPGASVPQYFVDTFMGSNFQDISSLQGVHAFPAKQRDNPNIGYSRDLGFDFEFYGETYDTVAVHTNGFVGFTTNPEDTGRNVNSLSQQVIGGATPGGVPIVAPFLDDLDPRRPESNFYAITLGEGTSEHRFIAQYSNYRVVEGERRVTFQVVLYAVDGKIEFRYHSVPGQGETAKVGISDGSNTPGNYIEYSRRQAVLNDDTRIVFTPIAPPVEGDDSPEITLLLSSALDTTATVELIPTDAGTAEFPADYVLPQSAIQIPAGAVTATIPLQIIDDDIYERIETGVLNLRVLRDGTVLSESSFEFKIVDNDLPPTISLDPVAPLVEGDTGLVTARLSGELGFPLLVTLVTSAATSANYLTDYEISVPTMMTIPTGSLTTIFEIQVTDDGIDEGPETFELGLRVPPDTVELSVNASRAVTILDEALPQLSLLEIAPIREGMAGMVTATLDIASGTTIAVELIPSHTDADLADYSTPTTLMAMILPGELSVAFTITAVADGIYEGIETLEFTLRVVGGGASVAEPRSRQLSIIDAEPVPSISFVEASSTIAEGARHDIELRLSGVSQDDITVTFETAGSATSGANADYTLAATTVTFPAESTSNAIIRLNVNADNLYEGLESETIVLRLVSATGGVIVDDTKFEHTVTITDNEDVPTVSLNSVRRQITEGNDDADALVITFELSDGVAVSEDITVDYVLEFPTIDATGNPRMAADAADFVGPTTGTVLIPAGESSAKIEIASDRSSGYRYLGFNTQREPFNDIAFRQAVATLIDTELIAQDVLEGLVSPTYSVVHESNGFWHNPDVPRFGSGLDRETRINEAVRILTAAGYSWTKVPSWDVTNTLVIAGEGFTDSSGNEVEEFEILTPEATEADPFRFAAANLIAGWLNEAGIPARVSPLPLNQVGNRLFDTDDYDVWIVGWNVEETYPRSHLATTFSSNSFRNFGSWANEEYDRLVQEFPVNEPTDAMGLARARELAFQLQAILARELPYVLLFPNPPATVGLALVDDSVSEEPELVGIRLTGARLVSGDTLMVADEPAIITILDNDSVEYVIEGAETVAEEDGAYVARLHRSGYTLSDDSVAYTVIGLGPNAADHNDFEFSGAQLPTGTFTFVGHDALSSEIRIALIDDDDPEGPETFRIEVARGVSTLTATRDVTLIDNDTPVVTATLRVSELSVSEGDTATLNIELSEAASEDVTLTLTVVAGGSAVESVDYDPLLVPVVIRAGLSELTVSIRTIDDDLTEETETFELVLSVLSGPAVTGTVDSVTVTIIDDDEAPVVPELPEVVVVTATLRVSELSVSEGDTATLNIELSEAASEDVTLTLTVVGGSAVESVDYEPLLVPVVIRAGVLELTVSIRTIDDELNEETETFELELSVLSGPAVTGTVDSVTVTITDDDEAPVVPELPEVVVVTATLRVSELSVSEGDTATLNIELSEAASEDVTLTLTVVAGGSAVCYG